jgi:hypothetical protein
MRILLTTNKFQQFAGSELVTLELAEQLIEFGHTCSIASWFIGPPMKNVAERLGIVLTDRPETVNAFDFDIVLAQHHVAPVLMYSLTSRSRERTLFIQRHLSVIGLFDLPGVVLEPLLTDCVHAVSPEAKAKLVELGVDPRSIELFPNPAPRRFHRALVPRKKRAESLLVVSNHAPAEVLAAISELRSRGLVVRHVGENGEGQARVNPRMIFDVDAVLTIGKTTQYCLRARVPVFIYDHFGGPGFLSRENIQQAAYTNFSGRCTRRRLSAIQIADEIMCGFENAAQFMTESDDVGLDEYALERSVAQICERASSAPPTIDRLAQLLANGPMLERERALCAGAGAAFRGRISYQKRWEAIRAKSI